MLVELDFIQQSLDFQDEYDKKQLHLFGLNEVNLSLDDLMNGSLAKYAQQSMDGANRKALDGTVSTLD